MTGFKATCLVVGSLALYACDIDAARIWADSTDAIPIATPASEPSESRLGCTVGPIPDRLSTNPFYTKHCDADGIPILSSEVVEDRAIRQAYYLVMNMLAPIPEVRRELIAQGAYVVILGIDQNLTSLPEYSRLDSEYWDRRARALGGSRHKPATSAPEDNLVCFRRDRYYGESILVHEFAHTIHLLGLGSRYRDFTAELTDLYDAALSRGLWGNTYAGSSVEEYWAEGVQSYFNTNLGTNPADGIHNQVNTRAELREYDPGLYDFMAAFFRDFEWTPTCP